jgi:hypothetical protein
MGSSQSAFCFHRRLSSTDKSQQVSLSPKEAIMVDGFSKTPRYVLKDGSHPTGPSVLHASSDAPPLVVFGFSDKPEYDVFSKASPLALTPYPLVKGFLENQIAEDSGSLRLVVLDATFPKQVVFNAATMQSVLNAFRVDSDRVAISHQLVLDDSSQGHRVREVANTAAANVVS